MSNVMDSVINTLGIDKVDTAGKMIAIEEQHGTDSTFLISTVIANAVKKNQAVCLVLYHNTFSHYHNIGMRLGYNMISLKDKGQLVIVEPMMDIANAVQNLCEEKLNLSDCILTRINRESNNDIVFKLFTAVKDNYYNAAKYNESVVLIIDDLSNLWAFNLSLRDIMFYIRYLESLLKVQPKTQLCMVCHTFQTDAEDCIPNIVSNILKYSAHLNVTVEPLRTGYSNEASGKLSVAWQSHSIRQKFNWPERTTHLYKLTDRQVRIFAPGMVGNFL